VLTHGVVVWRLTPVRKDERHADWRPWHGQPMYERHEEDDAWLPPLSSGSVDRPMSGNAEQQQQQQQQEEQQQRFSEVS
jgi:hypothetical protein